jgi:hypothetical protein
MIHRPVEARWRDVESNAHLPEVQEVIREEIRKGTIRVRPNPDGSIRIVPVRPRRKRSPKCSNLAQSPLT